ncbi:hypothetical protein FB45DRAFT_1058162 [Roridomyces roridus]|uniref:Uncharacterized protein n=1 Tax=Roridomyces roridus TaxID=1738132 RepID=A0AAD7BXY6_9AGAR|nr:hypothetical protein FB45DRAFT_1058162 [Roridomyces roridus]
MSFAVVPQELVDKIVEQARGKKNLTIQSLSLVARRFVAPSQRRLFRRIALSGESDDKKLNSVFTESTHLVRYPSSKARSPIAVLHMLTDLSSPEIAASRRRPDRLSWAQILLAVRSSICHAIRLPRSRVFSLDCVDDSMEFLIAF